MKYYKKMGLFLPVVALFFTSARHMGPSCDTKPRYALDRLGTELAKKHELTFLNSGLGILIDFDPAIWVLNFTSCQALTIEQARPLIADLSYQLLYKAHHDKLFAKYCQLSAGPHRSPDVEDKLLGIRLAFWDQNINRPLYPYLAQIRLADSKVYYYYADPQTQALQEAKVESLNELGLPDYKT